MKKTLLLLIGSVPALFASPAIANTCVNNECPVVFAVNSGGDVWEAEFSTNPSTPGFGSPTKVLTETLGSITQLFADFNGDGISDYVIWNSTSLTVYPGKSSGLGFGTPYTWTGSVSANEANLAGDVNGDGKADLIAWANNYVYVSISTGSGFGGTGSGTWWSGGSFYGNVTMLVADLNGDGYADLLAWDTNSSYYLLNNTAGGFGGTVSTWNSSPFYGSVAGGGNLLGTWRTEFNGVFTGPKHDMPIAWNQTNVYGEPYAGGSTSTQLSSGGFYGTEANISMDVNQDGWKDLVALSGSYVYVEFANGPTVYNYDNNFGSPVQYSGTSSIYGSVLTQGGTDHQ